jgi:hypothetical protein
MHRSAVAGGVEEEAEARRNACIASASDPREHWEVGDLTRQAVRSRARRGGWPRRGAGRGRRRWLPSGRGRRRGAAGRSGCRSRGRAPAAECTGASCPVSDMTLAIRPDRAEERPCRAEQGGRSDARRAFGRPCTTPRVTPPALHGALRRRASRWPSSEVHPTLLAPDHGRHPVRARRTPGGHTVDGSGIAVQPTGAKRTEPCGVHAVSVLSGPGRHRLPEAHSFASEGVCSVSPGSGFS